MDLQIRPMALLDAEEVGRLHAQVWRESYVGMLPDEWLAQVADQERIDRWRQIVETEDHSSRWVAVVDGVIAGFAISGPSRDVEPVRDLELWSIHVQRAFARRGVGRALAEAAIGDRPASVWVLTVNDPAQAFYRALGFELDGATSTVAYWDGAPDSRMTR